MGQIQASVGLVSGINYGQLITELLSLDQQPVTLLQTRVASTQEQQQAYSSFETSLQSIQQIGQNLALPQTFDSATATSSDPNTLTATTTDGAAVGSYQLQVAQLVTTQQSVSQGFANTDTAPIGAGTITLEEGGGEAFTETPLAQLNGGAGVPPGQFRITDASGNSAVIDTTDAVTLDDVVKKINTALGINVTASVGNNGLVLTDNSGGTGTLTVANLAGGSAATNLGIAGHATGTVLTGSNINTIGTSTPLTQLNDGRGVRTAGATLADFSVTLSDGSTHSITLGNDSSLGDVINTINAADPGKLTASVSPSGTGITLTDTTGGAGTMSVTALNSSKAASDLGILGTASGNTITGTPLIANLDSVLVSSLKGGSGLPLGTISITNRLNQTNSVNLSGANSVSDIINTINNTSGIGVKAAINSSGTGIQITDTSGGTGNLVIADDGSTTAAALGIAGTFAPTQTVVDGANLQRQYVSDNTLLSSYNGGAGVNLGQFTITNSAGISTLIDLSTGNVNTIGDVITAINSKNAGVTASINANGNGILLTDTAGGAGVLKVVDDGSTTASDLNIAGTATGTTIDGALQKTINVSSTDTLSSLQTTINQLGFGVTASIVNDGSATDPYRLSLTSINSGLDGRVIIDGGTTNLNPTTLVAAQDAAVLYGGQGSSNPLLITSSKNTLSNLINGVTINLVGATNTPVTLNVTQDPSAISTDLQNFTTDFNGIINSINTQTQFDTTTNTGGLLLGDATTQQIQEQLYNIVNTTVSGAGQYRSLADIGLTITDGAALSFDPNKFAAAFAADPTAVKNLFSQATTGLGNVINNGVNTLVDPVSGIITLENQDLATEIQGFQDNITDLNTQIANKKTLLTDQFANLETTLASLQSQQQALGSLTTVKPTTTSTSSNLSSIG